MLGKYLVNCAAWCMAPIWNMSSSIWLILLLWGLLFDYIDLHLVPSLPWFIPGFAINFFFVFCHLFSFWCMYLCSADFWSYFPIFVIAFGADLSFQLFSLHLCPSLLRFNNKIYFSYLPYNAVLVYWRFDPGSPTNFTATNAELRSLCCLCFSHCSRFSHHLLIRHWFLQLAWCLGWISCCFWCIKLAGVIKVALNHNMSLLMDLPKVLVFLVLITNHLFINPFLK